MKGRARGRPEEGEGEREAEERGREGGQKREGEGEASGEGDVAWRARGWKPGRSGGGAAPAGHGRLPLMTASDLETK